jgi:hypothetical protein
LIGNFRSICMVTTEWTMWSIKWRDSNWPVSDYPGLVWREKLQSASVWGYFTREKWQGWQGASRHFCGFCCRAVKFVQHERMGYRWAWAWVISILRIYWPNLRAYGTCAIGCSIQSSSDIHSVTCNY